MKYKHDTNLSGIAAAAAFFAFLVLWLSLAAAMIAPFIVHVVVCVQANWAAMLIIGLVLPPVGWVHGVGIIFGVWG